MDNEKFIEEVKTKSPYDLSCDFNLTKGQLVDIIKELDYAFYSNMDKKEYNKVIEKYRENLIEIYE